MTDTAHQVSRLVCPSRLQEKTINGETSYSLYSWRGERSLPLTPREETFQNDMFLAEAARFIDERARKEVSEEFPELVNEVKEDIHTPIPEISLRNQTVYDMNDLTFNLTPIRESFIFTYKHILKKSDYDELVLELDRRCERGEGCYYKTTVYPEVNMVGPVAMPCYLSNVITKVLFCSTNIQLTENLLTEVILPALRKHSPSSSVERQASQCIVCTLINQSAMKWRDQGSSFSNKNSPFLINCKGASNLGFRSFPLEDYSADIVNVNETGWSQISDVLDFKKCYTITKCGTFWLVSKNIA